MITTCRGRGKTGHAGAVPARAVVRIPDALPLNLHGSWTIELGIKPRATDTTRTQVVLGKYAAPDSVAYALELDGRSLPLRVSSGTRTQTVSSFPDVRPGEWQHVAVTYQQRTARIYVNGRAETAVGGIVTPRRSPGPLVLGSAQPPDTTRWYDGALDEIRIWAAARSARDLTAAMRRSLGGQEPWLVGYWRCDDDGGVLRDASRNANNGVLGNAAGPDPADPHGTTDAAPVR